MSTRHLNETEIKLLSKGLKFTPTPAKTNSKEIENDINEFTRKIKLAEYFNEAEDRDISIVTNKSSFMPPKHRNANLEKFINNIDSIPKDITHRDVRSNMTLNERKSIQDLINDPNIIIKEADKGGAVVIMDTSHYKEMISSQLSDKNYYGCLDHDPRNLDRKSYNKLTDKFKSCLTEKEYDYLKRIEVKESNFYGLPKVRKSAQINEACERAESTTVTIRNVDDLKLRPIIAGPSCQTHRLSILLDILLRPLTKHVKSNIRDTTDFLNSLPDGVQDEVILTTFDVESLYSNISHDLGLKAVEYWMDKVGEKLIQQRFPKSFILESLDFILKNNTFQFNDTFYRQTKGTAMGTKVAPVYATLVLGYIEEQLYEIIGRDYSENFKEYFINNWKRFLDDIFTLWPKSKEELDHLNKTLNSIHKDLKFTIQFNEKDS